MSGPTIEDHECGVSPCTCRWSSVNSASIDPPYPILDPWCPVHGGRDPDEEYERKRDDAPYGEWCHDQTLCAGKGYCPRDPTCGD